MVDQATASKVEAVADDALAEAMRNVDSAADKLSPSLAELKTALGNRAESDAAINSFVPKGKKAIETFVEEKIATSKREIQEVTNLIEQRQQDLAHKVEAMRFLQSEIVKLTATIGHLRTHKIILDMAHLSHSSALGEIVAQAIPEKPAQ